MVKKISDESPIACDLLALNTEQRLRRSELAGKVNGAVVGIQELPYGYTIRFPLDDSLWMLVAEFVTLERKCCPFLTFSFQAKSKENAFWLSLTGQKGVKEFLQAELGLSTVRAKHFP